MEFSPLNFRAPGGELYVRSEHVFEMQERYGGVYYHAEFNDAGTSPGRIGATIKFDVCLFLSATLLKGRPTDE